MIVGATVTEDDQELRARLLLHQASRRVTNGSSQARVILISDPADASFDFGRILLVEVLDDIKLHIVPALAREALDGVAVAHGLQGFAHEHQPFLFDVNDALARARGPHARRTRGDRARRRAGHIQQERDGHIALATQPPHVEPFGDASGRAPIQRIINHRLQIELLAVQFPADLLQRLGAQQLELMPDRGDHRPVLRAHGLDEVSRATPRGPLDHPTPGRAEIGQLMIPFLVVKRLISRLQLLLL
ncbi:hypothetical protein HRbin08_01453 [bacterium HR08]|nr:hypothetical protein HRbin08_01453 [bacterium HR08]